jgi:hypothetical protein
MKRPKKLKESIKKNWKKASDGQKLISVTMKNTKGAKYLSTTPQESGFTALV